jgi:hypothetical protein
MIEQIYHVHFSPEDLGRKNGHGRSMTIAKIKDCDNESEGSYYCDYSGTFNVLDLLRTSPLYLADDIEEAKRILKEKYS